ncbi:MAG TPA: hypothetical protein VF008_29145 [Niastella sp.]
MSLKINKRQFKKWIAALDSGEYKQCQLQLQDAYGYCCLGVGCKVVIHEKMQFKKDDRLYGTFPNDQLMALAWLTGINDDFEKKTGRYISWLNDSDGYTFPEIATLLELVYIHKILD